MDVMPPKLFYSPGACSLAPHIALEEAGVPFEPVLVDTKAGAHKEPAYLRINPKARVPALAIDDWVLTESPAILQFIARSYPDAGLWPDDLRTQAEAMEWLAWIASTVHVAYAHVRRAERYATSEAALADVRGKGLETSRDLWCAIEQRVGAGPWVLGEQYTVVDAYLFVFWLWGHAPVLQFRMAELCPVWSTQARSIGKRPAVQRALAREQITFPT